jgi:hypothetical protein
MALVRRELVIAREPEDVWRAIGDPAAISTWFPGITTAEVNGSSRVITTVSGLTMPEEIVTNDPVRRVFEYRITAPLLKDHLGSIEVTGAGAGRSLVRYETRCEPDTIALVIGGACGNALHELRRQLESEAAPAAAEEA